MTVRVHLDTDVGGDPDDACALAAVLGWPGATLLGITTNRTATAPAPAASTTASALPAAAGSRSRPGLDRR
ncbi:MAG TPA: hypothetical protein VKY90_01210 [Candidatus Dormibacteraeota bacterium]|nr:hypothetical protein [Candidatus Dormibacteraeota bacterium]